MMSRCKHADYETNMCVVRHPTQSARDVRSSDNTVLMRPGIARPADAAAAEKAAAALIVTL